MHSQSLEELIETEGLKKASEISYSIREDESSDADEKYYFECSIRDENQIDYPNLEIAGDMKIIDTACVFYTDKGLGFYVEDNDLLKRILMVIFHKDNYSENEISYTEQIITRKFGHLIRKI